MAEWILDVSALNQYVSQMLSGDPVLRSLRLRGEVSGFKAYPSGHWYFTLKDERCRISCVMFRQHAQRMSFRPHEGDQVILHGAVRLYEEGGGYQFVADGMRPEGVGSLYQQFERMKAKLQAEGLFDAERKRMLPIRPKKIAIVTSEAGAVLHDICRVSARRDPGVPLVLVPVPVQGEGAAAQIAAGIRKAGSLPGVDVMIVGRGGGSMEDLWAFNEEIVARAIAASPIPVISAVGHETDFTIADFVADVRASTPSNAAEMAVPDRSEMAAALQAMRGRFLASAQAALGQARLRVMQASKRLGAASPERRIALATQALTSTRQRLERLVDDHVAALSPRLSMASIRLDNAMDARMEKTRQQLRKSAAELAALNPKRVLERGYVLATTTSGRVITRAEDAAEKMRLHFWDGDVAVCRDKEETYGGKKETDL